MTRLLGRWPCVRVQEIDGKRKGGKAMRTTSKQRESVRLVGGFPAKLIADIEELLAERDALRKALGRIAAECAQPKPEISEVYHHCYCALVGDLMLPAQEQTRIMNEAIDNHE